MLYIILYISLLFNTFFCTSKLIKNKYNLVAKRDRIIIHCIFLYRSEKKEIYILFHFYYIIFFHYFYYVSDRNTLTMPPFGFRRCSLPRISQSTHSDFSSFPVSGYELGLRSPALLADAKFSPREASLRRDVSTF